MSFRCCAVVPVYNQPEGLVGVIEDLRAHGMECILVDDGSEPATAEGIRGIAQAWTGVEALRLPRNRGKGVAVVAGMRRARARGFSHVLQVDADGQHDLADLPALLEAAEAEPSALISGRPVYDETVPAGRVFARYITHVWVWIETLSLAIRDSMCGYRVYPLAESLAVADEEGVGDRMDFDTEIMVRLFWRGVPVRFISTRVRYDTASASTFRMVRDNVRISAMHTRLVFGMLRRLPGWLVRGRRPGGRRWHWSRITERGTALGMRLSVLGYRLLGRRGMAVVLFPAVLYFVAFNATARRASLDYFRRLSRFTDGVPKPGLLTVYRHFWQFVRANIDRVAAWSGEPLERNLSFPDADAFNALVESGQGALLIGAHLGNLEAARAITARWPDVKINALVYTANARKYNRIMQGLDERFGVRLIVVEDIGADTAMLLKSRIDDGEMVVIVGDRTPAAPDSPRVRVPFIGDPAPFPAGPWILAHALGCPVYHFFFMEEPDRGFRALLEPVADRLRLPRRGREERIRDLAGGFARRLETLVCQYPYQWYNFYDFWRDSGRSVSDRERSRSVSRESEQ